MAQKEVEVTFMREKETKNKQRFEEVDTDHIGKLYVSKATDEALGKPKALSVVLRAM